MSITYKLLNETHADYDATYWHQIRALAEGGKKLLDDKQLLTRLLPPRAGEEPDTYTARLAGAYYVPVMGQLIEQYVSTVFTDAFHVEPKAEAMGDDLEKEPDYYDELEANVSGSKSIRKPLNSFLREQLLTALLCRRSWSMVDLPAMDQAPSSLAEEEAMGLRDAYLCIADPEAVLDWEEDEKGELLWALVKSVSRKRMSVEADRSNVVETYTQYTATGWTRWTYSYSKDKKPTDKQEPDGVASGSHSFGVVPVRRLELPAGLWAGNKVASLAVELFRKACNYSYGEDKSLFQQLTATLDIKDGQYLDDDTDALANQTFGPGRLAIVNGGKLEFVSPQAAPFEVAQKSIEKLREEMSRVLAQMAHAVASQGEAQRRSAESKQVDLGAYLTICRALGEYVKHHARELFEIVARGRGEAQDFVATGGSEFDAEDSTSMLDEATAVEALAIPSPTFRAGYAFDLVKKTWKDAEAEQLLKVKQELSKAYSVEGSQAEMTDPADDDASE